MSTHFCLHSLFFSLHEFLFLRRKILADFCIDAIILLIVQWYHWLLLIEYIAYSINKTASNLNIKWSWQTLNYSSKGSDLVSWEQKVNIVVGLYKWANLWAEIALRNIPASMRRIECCLTTELKYRKEMWQTCVDITQEGCVLRWTQTRTDTHQRFSPFWTDAVGPFSVWRVRVEL